ncbi:SusD/RagB family nutrient-binding outer membrane lipoprotein [Wenyingzhuangia sp. chi5]|uniref:SusD/RagB family nutrient-binding outer membrane lipoprotein n=1 Tax=Wenyingzhuangia gilva TaxID=3057677 RepID=A0ABT8VS85_9FLAO|nr:SusD/RagB family nutrient-binding outer membrane lipoprotein [Wenyingzhuangia sp. chi5]MDO3694802.1 SusD/RagB family nutrient-binding outer membrane lipoprotein [Wenyingzhuangia sp. chi5]
MRIKNIILYISSLCLTLSSCDSDELLKVNENPNVATSIDPDYLLGYAAYAWTGVRTGGDLYLPVGWANQAFSTGGNAGWGYAEDRYDISPFSTGNTWSGYFVSVGNNLNIAIEQAESAEPKNNNGAAQCKLVLANTMFENTMIFGDIPFRQAWKADEFTSPVFDPQEQILNDLLTMIDEAIAQIDITSVLKISNNDPYYKGDMEKWIKFGTSLKLKILMTMVDKDPSKASDIGALVNSSELITLSADNFEIDYYDETNSENPKFKIFKNYAGGENPWVFANTIGFTFMEDRNDPRISIYFDANDNGDYLPVDTATEAALDTDANLLSSPISVTKLWTADAPDLILSASEIQLLRAEIYARGIGVTADLNMANTLYKAGVKESLVYYSVSETDATTYVNGDLPDISTMSASDAEKEIHIQQWIDFQDRTLEGWINWRRSGPEGSEVPDLQLPPGAPAGGLFRRYTYPSDELTSNKNAPSGAGDLKLHDNLWFDL